MSKFVAKPLHPNGPVAGDPRWIIRNPRGAMICMTMAGEDEQNAKMIADALNAAVLRKTHISLYIDQIPLCMATEAPNENKAMTLAAAESGHTLPVCEDCRRLYMLLPKEPARG